MPDGEAEDDQRRGHPDITASAGFRQLRRGIEGVPGEIPGGESEATSAAGAAHPQAQMAQAKQKQLAADDEDGSGKRGADDDGPMDGRRKKSRARKKKALEEG